MIGLDSFLEDFIEIEKYSSSEVIYKIKVGNTHKLDNTHCSSGNAI